MRVCVFGLWHLGTVTAACLAAAGHDVTGLDFDANTIERLRAGEPPLYEQGLSELVQRGLAAGTLRFTTAIADAVAGAEVVWVTFDTPVDADDRADVQFVTTAIESLFDALQDGTLVVISSQLPVGSTRQLEQAYRAKNRNERVSFACSPENLRLGKAIEAFQSPDRIVAGVRTGADRRTFQKLVEPLKANIEWMSVESAEMTKHALNAFLAASVTFINEIAVLCERVGADAKEVERALKSERRIGPRAYLSPGAAFAGGTLARDISFLQTIAAAHGVTVPLLGGVKAGNDAHKRWARTRLRDVLGDLRGRTIAVWGLTYKPGTDTLRRSLSVELCRGLIDDGAHVTANDPAVKQLPSDLLVRLSATPQEALAGADALVVATEWPEFRSVPASSAMPGLVVIDANRFLAATFGSRDDIRYYTVGKSSS